MQMYSPIYGNGSEAYLNKLQIPMDHVLLIKQAVTSGVILLSYPAADGDTPHSILAQMLSFTVLYRRTFPVAGMTVKTAITEIASALRDRAVEDAAMSLAIHRHGGGVVH